MSNYDEMFAEEQAHRDAEEMRRECQPPRYLQEPLIELPNTYTLNYDEQEAARHLLGHYNYEGGWKAGSFTTKLIELLESADQSNKERLFLGFPEMRKPVWIMQTQGGTALQELLNIHEEE